MNATSEAILRHAADALLTQLLGSRQPFPLRDFAPGDTLNAYVVSLTEDGWIVGRVAEVWGLRDERVAITSGVTTGAPLRAALIDSTWVLA